MRHSDVAIIEVHSATWRDHSTMWGCDSATGEAY